MAFRDPRTLGLFLWHCRLLKVGRLILIAAKCYREIRLTKDSEPSLEGNALRQRVNYQD